MTPRARACLILDQRARRRHIEYAQMPARESARQQVAVGPRVIGEAGGHLAGGAELVELQQCGLLPDAQGAVRRHLAMRRWVWVEGWGGGG